MKSHHTDSEGVTLPAYMLLGCIQIAGAVYRKVINSLRSEDLHSLSPYHPVHALRYSKELFSVYNGWGICSDFFPGTYRILVYYVVIGLPALLF